MSRRARSPAPGPLLPQAQESRSPAPPSSRPRDPGPIVFLPQDLGVRAPKPPPRIQGPEGPIPSSPRPADPLGYLVAPASAGSGRCGEGPGTPRRLGALRCWRSSAGRGHVAAPGGSRALTSLGTCRAWEGGGSRSSKALEGRMGEAGMSPLPGGWAAAAAAAPRVGKGQEPAALEGCGLQGSNPAQAFWASAFLSELRQWNK